MVWISREESENHGPGGRDPGSWRGYDEIVQDRCSLAMDALSSGKVWNRNASHSGLVLQLEGQRVESGCCHLTPPGPLDYTLRVGVLG